jgi:probable phosphoglycerate mutase
LRATLHTDGGARGNPGPAGIGAVLASLEGDVLGEVAEAIGATTNNVAEYRALIAGLELALDKGVTELDVYLDSQLVVSQMKGEWKIKKAELRPLALRANSLMNKFASTTIQHVPRELNADADKLANQAMDLASLDAEQDVEGQGQSPLFE